MKVLNEGVMEEMLKRENMLAAWQAVKTNHGAAGIDGISIEEFHPRLVQLFRASQRAVLAQ